MPSSIGLRVTSTVAVVRPPALRCSNGHWRNTNERRVPPLERWSCLLWVESSVIMAKPGIGVDEGISLVQNEMAYILARIGIRVQRGMAKN